MHVLTAAIWPAPVTLKPSKREKRLVLPCAVTHSGPQEVDAVQNLRNVSLQAYAQQAAEAQTKLASHISTQKAAAQERPGVPGDAGAAASGPASHAAAEEALEVCATLEMCQLAWQGWSRMFQ